MGNNPLAGDLSEMHFGDLRRLVLADVHYDEADDSLLQFVRLVIEGPDDPEFLDKLDKPDIRLSGWGIEHFSVSDYQENAKVNPYRRYESDVVKKFQSGAFNVESLIPGDIETLAINLPEKLSVGESLARHEKAFSESLAKHASKIESYYLRLNAWTAEPKGLVFFVHSDVNTDLGDYYWWRDPYYLREFATLDVKYVIWSRTDPVRSHFGYSAAIYNVDSLVERFSCSESLSS